MRIPVLLLAVAACAKSSAPPAETQPGTGSPPQSPSVGAASDEEAARHEIAKEHGVLGSTTASGGSAFEPLENAEGAKGGGGAPPRAQAAAQAAPPLTLTFDKLKIQGELTPQQVSGALGGLSDALRACHNGPSVVSVKLAFTIDTQGHIAHAKATTKDEPSIGRCISANLHTFAAPAPKAPVQVTVEVVFGR